MKVQKIADKVKPSAKMVSYIASYYKDVSGKEMAEMLNRNDFYVKIDPVTYRQLNHWEGLGLLPKREDSGWRKFSIMGALWVRMIFLFRQTFEISLDRVAEIKKYLQEGDKAYKSFMPMLEVYVSEALSNKRRVYLVVFEDMSAVPIEPEQLSEIVKQTKWGDMIIIDLNKLLKELMPKYDWIIE